MSKRKVEKYLEKITVSTYREKLFLPSLGIIEIFARVRSIDRSMQLRDLPSLCKNWWVFHKAERIRFKTVLFHSARPLDVSPLRIRNTAFAFHPYIPDSFQIHSTGMGWISRYPHPNIRHLSLRYWRYGIRCSGPDPRVLLFDMKKRAAYIEITKFFLMTKNVLPYRNIEKKLFIS